MQNLTSAVFNEDPSGVMEYIRFRQAYHQCCAYFTLAWKLMTAKICEEADEDESEFNQRFERFLQPLADPYNASFENAAWFDKHVTSPFRRILGPSVEQIFPHLVESPSGFRLWIRALIF